jgi:hypothetical protein
MHTLVRTYTLALILGVTVLAGSKAAADFVIADDLIVQGSTCTGLDCVNGEVFNFDTLILKENNLRIFFNDTSVSAGFPANKWRITINDSASGGANFFSIDDATANRSVFKVTAGAPANSLFVSSTGNVGIGTASPVLDLSITTTDTPAQRLEQTNGGGFTAQTWDIAGNEANFFVRDVTGGSRLPFRIRPGAPTSSLDIAANGNVGVGTASPVTATGGLVLHVNSASGAAVARLGNGAANGRQWELQSTVISGIGALNISNITDGSNPMTILSSGNIGIGTVTPTAQLHTTGSVTFGGIACSGANLRTDGAGVVSCATSSRQFKNITGDLTTNVALANVMALRPQTGSYKETPDVPEHWLIAEDVAAVDPALAVFKNGAPFAIKTQNVVADLVAVVQQQQRQIEELRRLVAARQ